MKLVKILFCMLVISILSASEGLKSSTFTFTHKYELILINGKVWIRPIGQEYVWKFLNGIGLPEGKKFSSPSEIKSIHADGNNLLALDHENYLYVMKFDFMKHNSWQWKHEIGLPYKKRMKIPDTARAWAVSHRGDVSKYYEDIAGQKFEIKVGVSTIYVLEESGTKIAYVDPWIPPNFNHKFTTPLNGRFVATNLSASSSTVFIINEAGEMYTRLFDYDSAGENPLFPYTYLGDNRKHPIRYHVLPAEEWRKQPSIDGTITDQITIVQNGLGNAGRELRVEGVDVEGDTGYFYKQIFDNKWTFKKDGHEIVDAFIRNDQRGVLADRMTKNYVGTLAGEDGDKIDITLVDFHHQCNSGQIIFVLKGTKYQVRLYVRRLKYKKNGKVIMKGRLIIPSSIYESRERSMVKIYRTIFRNKRFITIRLTMKDDELYGRGLSDKFKIMLTGK